MIKNARTNDTNTLKPDMIVIIILIISLVSFDTFIITVCDSSELKI